MAITAVLAAAQTIVILTRNIDLSVGSIVGVTAYVTGEYLAAHQSAPLLAVGLAMLRCALGLLNGTLVAYGRVPSIIVTLGTLAIYRTWLIDHAFAHHHRRLAAPVAGGVPQRTVLSLGGLDVRHGPDRCGGGDRCPPARAGRLRWGRWVYAVGSNPDAARREGLHRARHPGSVRPLRRPVGAGRLHVPVPLRDHHGGRGPGPGAGLGRRQPSSAGSASSAARAP